MQRIRTISTSKLPLTTVKPMTSPVTKQTVPSTAPASTAKKPEGHVTIRKLAQPSASEYYKKQELV
jgi:hypothetical protein